MQQIKIQINAIQDLGLRDACLYSYLCYKQQYFGWGKPFYQKMVDITAGCGLTNRQVRDGGKSLVERGLITAGYTDFKKHTYCVADKRSAYNPFVADIRSNHKLTKGQVVADIRSGPTTTESLLLNQPTTKPDERTPSELKAKWDSMSPAMQIMFKDSNPYKINQ